jgi:hypothetical protein
MKHQRPSFPARRGSSLAIAGLRALSVGDAKSRVRAVDTGADFSSHGAPFRRGWAIARGRAGRVIPV